MRKKTIVISAFLFLLVNITLFMFIPLAKGDVPEIEYTFSESVMYPFNNTVPYDNDTFNLAPNRVYSQHYPATYSFENDTIGNSPIGWINNDGNDCSSSIIESKESHNNVLQLYDNSNIAKANVFNDLDNSLFFGTIEFWFIKESIALDTTFYLYTYNTSLQYNIFLYFESNDLKYYDGIGFYTILADCILANEWYHIRIDFNDTSASYDVYFNTIFIGNNLDYVGIGQNTKRILIETDTVDSSYQIYIDAIQYNFNNSYNYTFDNNPYGYPLDWDCSDGTTVLPEAYNKTYVVELYDNGVNTPDMDNFDIPYQINRTLSFDILKPDTSLESQLRFEFNAYNGSSTSMADIYFNYNDLQYYDSGFVDIATNFMSDNTWYNITVVFNDYNYELDVYIDGVYQDTIPYENSANTGLGEIEIDAGSTVNFYCYLDNIYLSGDYLYNDNRFMTYTDYYNQLEPDKWEFAISDINTLNSLGFNNPLGWNMYEYYTAEINVVSEYPSGIDLSVQMETLLNNDQCILERVHTLYQDFIQITSTVENTYREGNSYAFNIVHKSTDSSTVVSLMFIGNDLSYYNGTAYHTLRTDIADDTKYTLDVWINYELDSFFLDFYDTGIFIERYDNLTLGGFTGKAGLSEVEYNLLTTGSNHHVVWHVDSCGIYEWLAPQTLELGFSQFDLNYAPDFSLEHHNLLSIQAYGDIWLSVCSGYFSSIGQTIRILRQSGWNFYDNELLMVNNHEYHVANVSNANMVLWLKTTSFNITSMEITGVRLHDNLLNNTYILEESIGGIDDTDGYFYVDSQNRLNWYLIYDDTNTEYINASFNIADVSTTNYSLGYSSYIDYAYGYVYPNYYESVQEFPIYSYINTRYYVLAQNITLYTLDILITDNDNDYILGTSTGYITDISLFPSYTVSYDLVFTDMLFMFIPLIIIFIPSLLIGYRYKSIIVPMIAFMSIICFITSLIPIWLLFIVFFSSIVYFIINREKKDDFL